MSDISDHIEALIEIRDALISFHGCPVWRVESLERRFKRLYVVVYDMMVKLNPSDAPQPPNKPRRRTKRTERLTPCEVCEFPISQRHHILDVGIYGENDSCVQLCGNCHELYHLFMSSAFTDERMRPDKAAAILDAILDQIPESQLIGVKYLFYIRFTAFHRFLESPEGASMKATRELIARITNRQK